MGVNLEGGGVADPAGPVSWMDTMENAAQELGDGLGQGLTGLLGMFGDLFGSILGKRPPRDPVPVTMSALKDNLEADLAPFMATVDGAITDAGAALDEADALNEELAILVDDDHPDSKLWEIQGRITEVHGDAIEALTTATAANKAALEATQQYITRMIFVPAGSGVENDHWLITRSGTSVTLTPKAGWVGVAIIGYSVTRRDSVEGGYDWDTRQVWRQNAVPFLSEPSLTLSSVRGGSGSGGDAPAAVLVMYTVYPGTAKSMRGVNAGPVTLDDGVWTSLVSWTAPYDTRISAEAVMTWSAKTFLGNYSMRIVRVRGGQLSNITASTTNRAAPLFGSGARTHSAGIEHQAVVAGDIIRVEAWASHSNPANRVVRDAAMDIGWIVPADGGGEAPTGPQATFTADVNWLFTSAGGDDSFWYFDGAILVLTAPATCNRAVTVESATVPQRVINAGSTIPAGEWVYGSSGVGSYVFTVI